MDTIIPAGYRVTVVSWENDGDNYNTKVKEGLSKEHTEFIVALCSMVKSSRKNGSLGNMYDPIEAEVEKFRLAMAEFFKEYPIPSDVFGGDEPFVMSDDEDAAELATEILYEYGLSCGEWFTRVCESVKVEYVNSPIVLKDVTEEFTKS